MIQLSIVLAGILIVNLEAFPGMASTIRGEDTDSDTAAQQEQPPRENIKVDIEPTVKKTGSPKYPAEALRQGIEGVVRVKVWIGTTGEPRSVEILQTDNPIFNESSLAAAREFRFTPATLNGKPVSVWVTIPFNYRIAPGKQEHPAAHDSGAITLELRSAIEIVLEGKDSARIAALVDPECLFVYKTREEPLLAATRSHLLQQLIPTGAERRIQSLRASFSDDLRWASVVVRTGSSQRNVTHMHTVVMVKERSSGWHIHQWHMSD